VARELGGDLVDALSHDQHWAIGSFRQKVSQRPVETSSQNDALAVLRNERKGSVDFENCAHVTSEQPASSLRFVDRPQSLGIL
jgi:hypothetical protein